MKKIISIAAAVMLIAASVLPAVTVSAAQAPQIFTGQKSGTVTELKNGSGQNTGVKWSEIILNSGAYGSSEAKVNLVEFDLANTNLSLDVINNGQYITSKGKVSASASAFNSANPGKTVLAAVNGDLWLVESQYKNTIQSGKTLYVSRGALMIDREVWASAQIDQENLDSTTFEKGKPTEERPAFAVTDTNQPFVGSPVFAFTMTVNGTTVKANGLNRLPARNAIIIYNQRVGSANYALDDAYEVEIDVNGSDAFTVNGTVTGTVRAVYPANSATRPAISAGKLVITARGNRVSDLQNNFPVGSTVSIKCTVTDRFGDVYTKMWPNVVDCIGGWMQQLNSKTPVTFNSEQTDYPTTMIGIKDDGTVMFATVTSQTDKSRAALRYDLAFRFCCEAGYNSVFYLDGGGSTTCVTLQNGTYTVRNKCSDGSERSVINSVAVCWNDTKVCSKQGKLDYIINNGADMVSASPEHFDWAWTMLSTSLSYSNSIGAFRAATFEGENAFQIKAGGADAFFPLHFTTHREIRAQDYPYIVLKVGTDLNRSSSLRLFLQCGKDEGATGKVTVAETIQGSSAGWQYVVFKPGTQSGWTGRVNNIRIDLFDGGESNSNSIYIAGVTLCKTLEQANKVKDGWLPTGAVTDSLTYLSSGGKQGCYDGSYTIKFVNDNGAVLQTCEVAGGDMPSYTGGTPTKDATAQYTYTFKDWSPAIETANGDATYKATYKSTVNKYTVRFLNEDGTELQSSKLDFGKTPSYKGQTPEKAPGDGLVYTFSGWSPSISKVSGDVDYTAVFESAPAADTDETSSDVSETVTDVSSETETQDIGTSEPVTSENVTSEALTSETDAESSAGETTAPDESVTEKTGDTTSQYVISDNHTGLYVVVGIIASLVIAAAVILIVRARGK